MGPEKAGRPAVPACRVPGSPIRAPVPGPTFTPGPALCSMTDRRRGLSTFSANGHPVPSPHAQGTLAGMGLGSGGGRWAAGMAGAGVPSSPSRAAHLSLSRCPRLAEPAGLGPWGPATDPQAWGGGGGRLQPLPASALPP